MSWPAHLDSLRRVIEQVELGKLEPAEAEAEAARLGVAPLASAPDRFDPHKEPHWTVLMALAWIMWRDVDQVRELWDSWREQITWLWLKRRLPDGTVRAGHVLESKVKATLKCLRTSAAAETASGNPPSQSVGGAREELWRVLQEGKLKATGIDTTTGRRVEIPALDWLDLELVEHVQDPSQGDEVRRRGLAFGGYPDVRVPSADVCSCFPAPGETPILTETRPVLATHPIQPEFEDRAATGQVADSGTQQKTDPKAPPRAHGGKKKGDGSYERLDEPLILRGIEMYNAGEVASPAAAAKKLANEAHGDGTYESKHQGLAKRIRRKLRTAN